MLRVITGEARGRKLKAVEGLATRPTTDRTKQSLFNAIQFDIEGRRVLDLFAGTGQLGIEALSRGAAECVFVDSSRDSLRLVQENLKRCGLRAPTVQCEALGYLRRGERFDLIFIDPPYGSGLDVQAVQAVKEFDILAKGGIMVCESRADQTLPDPGVEFGSVRTYRYGKIKLTVITRGT